jgi:hypothetical protein
MTHREKNCLKINYVGIIGAILAFVSLALPWWTESYSSAGVSGSYDLYLYNVPTAFSIIDTWFVWAAIALAIIGGLLGIVGSVTAAMGKKILIGAGVITLLSIIVFAAGLQNELSKIPISGIGLISSSSYTIGSMTVSWSTYLSYGFWLALVSAIILFVAIRMQPAEGVPSSQPPT